ncbi:TPA: hypothetical protein U0629_001839 [Streptococcus suis]|nr:hypothetical protein [Streptococcus suis]HEM2804014.1 hypothetical protein [Streptococcus suis]HEM2831392.1 hypothetical protein [Streptococcus suis]
MRFKKKHYRPKVDTRDCGVAALAMVFGSYYSLATLRELTKTTQEGTFRKAFAKKSKSLYNGFS